MAENKSEDVGYPRIERNERGEPIINIGPYGGMAVAAAMTYTFLPNRWPDDWPDSGVIAMDDPRVAGACSGDLKVTTDEGRLLLYYEERTVEGEQEEDHAT